MAPAHEITIMPTHQHVEVVIGGATVAKSDRPVVLEETGLTTRYYLPREDVRMDLLRPTSTETTCPFKGEATYWTVETGDGVYEDVVWAYEHPIPAAEGITGLLCFYNERVELTVSGPPTA